MAGEARDDEATWRDLVAQYSTPAADGAVPWPVREELSGARQAPSMDTTDRRGPSGAPGTASTGDPGTGRAPGTGGQAGPHADQTGPGADRAGPHADQTGPGADRAGPHADQAGPDADQEDPRADQEDPGAAQPPQRGWDPVPGVIPVQPPTRIVRPAVPAPLPPTGDDEHYVPPVPPPLPRLDPVSKGAWAALFGGPGYLLLAVLLGWVVPSWAAFGAVAAFVGGFATLVVRMGDRPPDDSGSDDGAMV
jgi:hypothetical protein